MIPVDQTIFDFQKGNCMQACVASIFEMALDKVPNFMENGLHQFYDKLEKWCNSYGLLALDIIVTAPLLLKDTYVVAVGQSPRSKDKKHGVVWYNGIVHDPHPDRIGLIGDPERYTVFIIKDPTQFRYFVHFQN